MSTSTASRSYSNDTLIDGTDPDTYAIETTITQSGVDRRFHCLIADAVVAECEHLLEGPLISIGTNSPDYNNLVEAQRVGGILGSIAAITLSPDRPEIGEGVDIKCKVISAAIPTLFQTATCMLKINLFGIDNLYSE